MKTKLEKLKADYNKLGTKQRASKIGQSLKEKINQLSTEQMI